MNIAKITEFHKLWSGLLEPLPAIVAALEQKDELIRQVEALELRRQKSIDEAREGVEKLTQTSERLASEIKELHAKKITATNDLVAHRRACASEIEGLNASVVAAAADVKKQVEAIQASATEAENAKAALLRDAEQAHADATARMATEVAELEERCRVAQKSMTRLKSRLEV